MSPCNQICGNRKYLGGVSYQAVKWRQHKQPLHTLNEIPKWLSQTKVQGYLLVRLCTVHGPN